MAAAQQQLASPAPRVIAGLLRRATQAGDADFDRLLGDLWAASHQLLAEPLPPPAQAQDDSGGVAREAEPHSPPSRGSAATESAGDTEGGAGAPAGAGAEAGAVPPFEATPSPFWRKLGFQGNDPQTEFRGSGHLGLRCLLRFIVDHPECACKLLASPIPLAAASINVTMLVADLLSVNLPPVDDGADGDLTRGFFANVSARVRTARERDPSTWHPLLRGANGEGVRVFFTVHAIAMHTLERVAREGGATIMDFAGVLDATEEELRVLLNLLPDHADQLWTLVRSVPGRKAGYLDLQRTAGLFGKPAFERVWCCLSCSKFKFFRESDVYGAKGTAVVFEAKPMGDFVLESGARCLFTMQVLAFTLVNGRQRYVFRASSTQEVEQWCIAFTEHTAMLQLLSSLDDPPDAPDGSGRMPRGTRRGSSSQTLRTTKVDMTFRVNPGFGIYLRREPRVASPKTGRAVMPNQVVRVCSECVTTDGHVFYLVAAQDKDNSEESGWLMQRHPTSGVLLLIPS